MNLDAFLLARIAEDEAAADRVVFMPYVGDGAPSSLRARVLAECRAKREIVLQQIESERASELDEGGAWAGGMAYAGELAMKALATVYADHPDYREEWRGR